MITYMDITSYEEKAQCGMCLGIAEVFLKCETKDRGKTHLMLCKKCFERLKNDFSKGDIKEIVPRKLVAIDEL